MQMHMAIIIHANVHGINDTLISPLTTSSVTMRTRLKRVYSWLIARCRQDRVKCIVYCKRFFGSFTEELLLQTFGLVSNKSISPLKLHEMLLSAGKKDGQRTT